MIIISCRIRLVSYMAVKTGWKQSLLLKNEDVVALLDLQLTAANTAMQLYVNSACYYSAEPEGTLYPIGPVLDLSLRRR